MALYISTSHLVTLYGYEKKQAKEHIHYERLFSHNFQLGHNPLKVLGLLEFSSFETIQRKFEKLHQDQVIHIGEGFFQSHQTINIKEFPNFLIPQCHDSEKVWDAIVKICKLLLMKAKMKQILLFSIRNINRISFYYHVIEIRLRNYWFKRSKITINILLVPHLSIFSLTTIYGS